LAGAGSPGASWRCKRRADAPDVHRPSGDSGSDATPYVDIRDVTAGTKALSFDLISKPPNVDPSQAWIAYGVVVDVDRDGVPDWRYGMDNLPRAAGEDQTHHRAWRTNLHTGLTEFNSNAWGGDEMDQVGNGHFGSSYPATENGPSFLFYETGDVTGGGGFKLGAKQDKPFYVWASAIVDGQVVATDYAPDTGWLDPTLGGANPGGTYLLPKLANAPSPFRLTLTVPQGWTAAGGFLSPSQDNGLGLQFLIADHPAEWACDASGRALKPPVGSGVDDLVAFLASQQPKGMIAISSTTDVTLDGYRGTYLEYSTSYDENTNCQPPEWPYDRTGFHQVWILDVDGVRLVIDGSAPRTSDAVKAQIGQIVASIAVEPSTTVEPVPSPTPTPTPSPVPTPTPTPFPAAAGPVPQGARSWEVTVENKSSKAVTLFLAREPLNDMGDLCGSVTPDVVAAGVTEKVTFRLPPTSVNDCWLMIRPGPGASGDLGPTDNWPTPGKLVIHDGGDNANGDDLSTVWQGP
jgi:hypothetical protein